MGTVEAIVGIHELTLISREQDTSLAVMPSMTSEINPSDKACVHMPR
jgi:hypothetical protein